MDLIYTNADREDVGVLKDYTFDLAFGSSENDFECKVYKENHCCLEIIFCTLTAQNTAALLTA